MQKSIDRNRTLEELEQNMWGNPAYPSHVVTTIHILRQKPLNQFTVEDLRIYIGQGFGLDYLIPIALEILNENPFVEGDFFAGDLLQNVVRASKEFWSNNPEPLLQIKSVMAIAQNKLSSVSDDERKLFVELQEYFNKTFATA